MGRINLKNCIASVAAFNKRVANNTQPGLAETATFREVNDFDWLSYSPKMQRMRSFVTSVFLYACEPWTLTAELQR